jgi:hypothetical protein
MLCSCNIRTFYEFIEKYLPSTGVQPKIKTEDEPVKFYKSDDEFIVDFLTIFQDELKDVRASLLTLTDGSMSVWKA